MPITYFIVFKVQLKRSKCQAISCLDATYINVIYRIVNKIKTMTRKHITC